MTSLAQIRLEHPNEVSKFHREKVGYKRQWRKMLGYTDELDGKGRNS